MNRLILKYQKKKDIAPDEEIKILYQIAKGVLDDVTKYFVNKGEPITDEKLLKYLKINNMFYFFEYIKSNGLQEEYPNVYQLFSSHEEEVENNHKALTAFEVIYFQIYDILQAILRKGERNERN